MAKIDEYFLKAIFNEKDIEIEDKSITSAISKMVKLIVPELIQETEGNYDLYYSVPFEKLKNTNINEEQAFELRQYGWILNDSEDKIIKKL